MSSNILKKIVRSLKFVGLALVLFLFALLRFPFGNSSEKEETLSDKNKNNILPKAYASHLCTPGDGGSGDAGDDDADDDGD